eukprot:scaffold365120_cov44-Prasinocladus_malaysianus.AAC.1
MSGYDGSRPEMAVISENYVKLYVNNGGYYSVANYDDIKSTIYYQLCTVGSDGTESCPATYLELGEYKITDNPFILINDLADVSSPANLCAQLVRLTYCWSKASLPRHSQLNLFAGHCKHIN